MKLDIPYGAANVTADMAWGRSLGTLDVADVPGAPNPEQAVRDAVERPIGLDKNLYELISPGDTIAILVSDAFRETRADRFLPVLVNGLNRAGIPDQAMTIVFATGTHRPPTTDEQETILGAPVYQRFRGRLFTHDPDDEANLVLVGATSRGTPVRLNRRVLDSDRIIATGAVVLHYFAGYGGGRKSIVPGIASRETIEHNHAMTLDPFENRLNPAVRIGALDGNPVAEDMLEAARLARVDYILNTVLNREEQMAAVFAGELDTAHRTAAAYARDLFAVSIAEQADLVVASSGTTRNFVQVHKALFNAYQAVKPQGRIILLAECPEGLGGEQFIQWIRLGHRDAIIAALREHSEINGQTALSTVDKAPITILVTDMSDVEVRELGAQKAPSLEDALELARRDLTETGVDNPTCYLMPSAAYTVPSFAKA